MKKDSILSKLLKLLQRKLHCKGTIITIHIQVLTLRRSISWFTKILLYLSSREIGLLFNGYITIYRIFYKSRYNSDYIGIPVSWPSLGANSYRIPIENIAWHFQTFVSSRLSIGSPVTLSGNLIQTLIRIPPNAYPDKLVLKFVLEILLLYPICLSTTFQSLVYSSHLFLLRAYYYYT